MWYFFTITRNRDKTCEREEIGISGKPHNSGRLFRFSRIVLQFSPTTTTTTATADLRVAASANTRSADHKRRGKLLFLLQSVVRCLSPLIILLLSRYYYGIATVFVLFFVDRAIVRGRVVRTDVVSCGDVTEPARQQMRDTKPFCLSPETVPINNNRQQQR